MHERAPLVVETLELACNEFAVPFEESGGSGRLVLVEGLTFRLVRLVQAAERPHTPQSRFLTPSSGQAYSAPNPLPSCSSAAIGSTAGRRE